MKRKNTDISQTYQRESSLEIIKNHSMTYPAAQTVKDQDVMSLGLIESASVNSITDFTPSQLDESITTTKKENFVNTFICHLIFYGIFCVTLVLHIIIDLGLGDLIKNKFILPIQLAKGSVINKSPAFA